MFQFVIAVTSQLGSPGLFGIILARVKYKKLVNIGNVVTCFWSHFSQYWDTIVKQLQRMWLNRLDRKLVFPQKDYPLYSPASYSLFPGHPSAVVRGCQHSHLCILWPWATQEFPLILQDSQIVLCRRRQMF